MPDFFIPHYIITRSHYVWCQMNSAVMLLQLAEAGTQQHMVKLHNISHFGACSSPVSGWQSASVNKISSETTYWLTYCRQCSFWTASEAGTGFEWKHTHTHTRLSAHNALEWNTPSPCCVNINTDRKTFWCFYFSVVPNLAQSRIHVSCLQRSPVCESPQSNLFFQHLSSHLELHAPLHTSVPNYIQDL